MEISLWQAILIAIAAYLGASTWWIGVGYFVTYRPLIAGTVVGAILGDVTTGMKIGATINLVYLGFISTGGSLYGDLIFAGYIATALAMAAGMEIETVPSLAITLGLLGSFVWYFRMTVDSFFVHWADALAERGNARGVALVNLIPGQLLMFLLYSGATFIAVYFGAGVVEQVKAWLPPQLEAALAIIGGMLGAIGIGMLLYYMGRLRLMPYFLIGFLLATYLKLPITAIAFFGLAAAYLHVQQQDAEDTASFTPAAETEKREHQRALTRGDLLKSWFYWLTFSHSCYNYERMQGLGFAHAMQPVIQRFYRSTTDAAAALKRHLVFFNTEPNVGAIVPGVVAAMEEERANGAPLTDETINNIKSGLMGPLAGIGDPLTQGLITPTLLAIGISLALEGNVLGPIFYTISVSIVIIGISYFMYMRGYQWGKRAVEQLLAGGAVQRVTEGASVLGLMVVGGLTASVVKLALTVQFVFGETVSQLQTDLLESMPADMAAEFTAKGQVLSLQADVLDKIMPNLLPLLLTLLVWWLLKRGVSALSIIGLLCVIGIDAVYMGLTGWAWMPTTLNLRGLLSVPPLVVTAIAVGVYFLKRKT